MCLSYYLYFIMILNWRSYHIQLYWCPTPFPSQVMLVSFNRNTTGVFSGAETASSSDAHEFPTDFNGTRVVQTLVIFVVFCGSLLVMLSIYCWPFSVLLRFTASDYTKGIFKLFLLNTTLDTNILIGRVVVVDDDLYIRFMLSLVITFLFIFYLLWKKLVIKKS